MSMHILRNTILAPAQGVQPGGAPGCQAENAGSVTFPVGVCLHSHHHSKFFLGEKKKIDVWSAEELVWESNPGLRNAGAASDQ